MNTNIVEYINLLTAIMFILSLRGLAFPRSAYRSNMLGIIGMSIAIIISLISNSHLQLVLLTITIGAFIGIFISKKIAMTSLPETIAAFNGLGGLSAFLIAVCTMLNFHNSIDVPLGAIIGVFTFSGSFIAFAKLHRLIKDREYSILRYINVILSSILLLLIIIYITQSNTNIFWCISILAFVLGISITLRVGGADMPIAISILNAGSGIASSIVGFIIGNQLLIITGTLVGASGLILSYIMCKAMNRSLINILLGHTHNQKTNIANKQKTVKTTSPVDAAFIMENAHKVIIVPGYGMAVAKAQYVLKQMSEILHNQYNVEVKFAIHPVAGRMPGHMNVLLAEAEVPYENIFELNSINHEFATTDVAYIIGANDITNPLAKEDKSSPLYGMPILEVNKAKTVLVVKRSMAHGYSNTDNPLFYNDNTLMLFGDAKLITSEIISTLESQ